MKEENVIQDKSYRFAIRIVKACQYLNKEKKEFVLSKQLLRAGTSIGANVEEAIGGQSRKEFFSKLSVSYKEARETRYWLHLLKDTDILKPNEADSLLQDVEELIRILASILLGLQGKRKTDPDG